jgi:hypothetical protein
MGPGDLPINETPASAALGLHSLEHPGLGARRGPIAPGYSSP